MTEPRFSFFRAPVTNTRPLRSITLRDAFAYITGPYARERTARLRTITDHATARSFKATAFDYCTFSGTFTTRRDDAILQRSGLLCIDFDHLEDTETLFNRLIQDSHLETMLLFRSPSGHGLKWIVPVTDTSIPHRDYFTAVSNYLFSTYGIRPDRSGKDLSRACFLPYDPAAYIHPQIP